LKFINLGIPINNKNKKQKTKNKKQKTKKNKTKKTVFSTPVYWNSMRRLSKCFK